MTTLTIRQTYDLARRNGLTHDEAVTATAIGIGESGLRTTATGDVSLQTATWGPSLGIWQIRSLKRDYGTGRTRDGARLKDPAFNARSMAAVSSRGDNFKPWTVYTSGAYKAYLGKVRAAVGGKASDPSQDSPTYAGGTPAAPARVQLAGYQAAVDVTPWGIPTNPFKMPGYVAGKAEELARGAGEDVADATRRAMWDALGPLILSTVALLGGVTLVIVGLARAVRPAADAAVDRGAELAGIAATGGATKAAGGAAKTAKGTR